MYLRKIVWNPETPALAMFVEPPVPSFKCGRPTSKWAFKTDLRSSWSFQGYENKPLKVMVFSNCPEVKLTLNGKNIGSKKLQEKDQYVLEWQVPYESGVLTAAGYDNNGNKIAEWTLATTGKPAAVKLTPDRVEINADGKDLCFIKADIVDKDGHRCPDAANTVHFKIEGAGKIIAVGNADPSSHESNQASFRKAFQGRCMVVIQSSEEPGNIKLSAFSKGLKESEITIKSLNKN
jgi:beta-galactosidase